MLDRVSEPVSVRPDSGLGNSVESGSADVKEILFRKTMGITAAAHELKTPLSILIGYTKLLREETLGSLNEQQHRVVAEMEQGATRLQRFVNDFLAFGALESGKLAPNRSLQDINHTVSEVAGIWMPRFEQAAKSLSFTPGESIPLVPFDELKVQHVISNLLDNALKFTPRSGSVFISTRSYFWERRLSRCANASGAERRRASIRKPNAVRVDVRDTGPGIPSEFHMEIFSEFHRLRNSRNADGVGLGLAIAKRLIDAHGGRIWIDSGSGPGATFSFLLPVS